MADEIKTVPETAEVVDIQFRAGQKVYYFDPAGHACKQGDHVIIDTARGPEYGYCTGGNHTISAKEVVSPLRPVLRLATAHDEKIAEENHAKEARAHEVCMQQVQAQGLEALFHSAEEAADMGLTAFADKQLLVDVSQIQSVAEQRNSRDVRQVEQ